MTNLLIATSKLMESKDYKDRFKAEYLQLKIRLERIENFVEAWDSNELNITPESPRGLYDLQIQAMKDYLIVLETRAKIEGVDLNDSD